MEFRARRFGSSLVRTVGSGMFGLLLLCWPLLRLLSLVLGWFLARVPAVLGSLDLLLFFFLKIVYRFGFMIIRFI